MKTVAVVIAVVLAAIAAAVVWRSGDEKVVAGLPVGRAPKGADLPATSVLRINPRTAVSTPGPFATPPASLPPEVTQLRSRTGWAPLKDRMAGMPATGATLYVQAEIYNRCARRPPSARSGAPASREEARQRFIAANEGQPDFAQRLAAYDKNAVNSCEGIPQEDFSEEKLNALIAAAAQAGDPRAQAWQVANAIRQAREASMAAGGPPRGLPITDEQVDTIRQALASRDPGVVRELQGILSSTLADGTWRIGGVDGRVDERALNAALTLVACDLGDNCGPDSRDLITACAMNGYCAAGNMYDHMYFYESSPNTAQLMERYRQALLQAINSGDLSSLRIAREPVNQNRQYLFSGRRGP